MKQHRTYQAPAKNDYFAELSDSERRVATLAALGYSNREVATRLYVTVTTVEQHLTRVYRKLSIRNREELPTSPANGCGRDGLIRTPAPPRLAVAGTRLP